MACFRAQRCGLRKAGGRELCLWNSAETASGRRCGRQQQRRHDVNIAISSCIRTRTPRDSIPMPRTHTHVLSTIAHPPAALSSTHTNFLLPPPILLAPIPHRARPTKRILRKRPRKRLLTADLLTAHETVHGNGDGAIDVSAAAVLAQPHLGERLADAEDGFEMADLLNKLVRVVVRV